MGIKDVFNQAPSVEEEALYKQVLDEVESGVMRKGVYAKALADGLGDEGKAQSLYIKYRVQSLVDEQKDKAKLLGIELAEKERYRKATEKAEEARIIAKQDAEFDNSHIGKHFYKYWYTFVAVVCLAILIYGEVIF